MSLGIEKAREQLGYGTHTEQCDRAVAQAVRENDELRTAIRRTRARHSDCGDGDGMCHECDCPIPCPTIQDLGDAK